jgi:hypothetical protein
LASKQTLGRAIGQRFPFVAKAATKARVLIPAEGGHADGAASQKGIDHRTFPTRCRGGRAGDQVVTQAEGLPDDEPLAPAGRSVSGCGGE